MLPREYGRRRADDVLRQGRGSNVLATYDAADNLTSTYVYVGGERLARVAAGVVSYYLKDNLR